MTTINELLGMEVPPGIAMLSAFAVFLVFLLLALWIIRKVVGRSRLPGGKNRQPRLAVTEAAVVDDKRRLVLVRRDNVEHLLMIGGPNDLILEQEIIRVRPALQPATDLRAGNASAINQSDSSGQNPAEKSKEAKGFAASLASGAVGGVAGVGSSIKSAGKSAGDKAVEGTQAIANKGVDATKSTAASIKEVGKSGMDAVGNAGSAVAGATAGAGAALAAGADKAVSNTTSAVASAASTTTDAAKSAASSTAATASKVGSAAVEKVSQAASTVVDTTSSVASTAIEPIKPADSDKTPDAKAQMDDSLLNDGEDLETVLANDLDIDLDIDEEDLISSEQENGNPATIPAAQEENIEDEMQRMLDELSGKR